MSKLYTLVKSYQKKYPLAIAWRLKEHCQIIEQHLNPSEEVLYAFAAQKNNRSFDFVNTNVIALTNRRLIIATKRLLWGYFYTTVTPDMFNDLSINHGLIWGKVVIDTVKETITLSNIPSKALPEIETQISSYMIREKKKYHSKEKEAK